MHIIALKKTFVNLPHAISFIAENSIL